jgi:hypothetical protein
MDKKGKISNHISYDEATYSSTANRLGIDNTPGPEHIKNMKKVAEAVFEPLREHFGVPIGVTSFYRCEALNRALRGSLRSSHMKGEAMDLDADVYGGLSNKDIFDYIKDNLEFDQLIWEFGSDENPAWVHVSYSEGNNRMQKLIAKKVDGLTTYIAI